MEEHGAAAAHRLRDEAHGRLQLPCGLRRARRRLHLRLARGCATLREIADIAGEIAGEIAEIAGEIAEIASEIAEIAGEIALDEVVLDALEGGQVAARA